MKKIVVIMAALIALTACKSGDKKLDPKQQVDRDNLTAQVTPGMWKVQQNVVIYSETDHQLYCGTQLLTSRIMNLTTSEYAEVVFKKKPVVDKDVEASVFVSSGFGQAQSFSTTFRVLKIDMDLIYIWSDAENFGAIMFWKQ